MKCETCEQPKTATINGRVFCENCGKQAAERLRQFRSGLDITKPVTDEKQQNQPHPSSKPAQVLDLSQYNQTEEVKPAVTQEKVHFGGDITHNRASDQRQRYPQDSPTTSETAPPVATAQGMDIAAQQPATHSQTSTAQPQSTAVEPTPMQPHQTYSLKDEPPSPADHDTQPATDEDLAAIAQQHAEVQPPKKDQPQPPRKGLRRLLAPRLTRVAAIGLSAVLLIGYISYLNYPDIAVRVAASNAGIEASMPDYVPDGYRFSGPVAYGSGELQISFTSDDGSVQVAQSQTDWDTTSLRDNYIRQETADYETYRDGGLTVYTYGSGNAAWVNNGMLYIIESDSGIDSDQLVEMARSI